mmetsp:Transcript_6022/g.21997  ORF Transcript_6022/g.21997 Transcript_6022/m.21997 type:complete len:236 (-) Transcript_6022:257-964(-)
MRDRGRRRRAKGEGEGDQARVREGVRMLQERERQAGREGSREAPEGASEPPAAALRVRPDLAQSRARDVRGESEISREGFQRDSRSRQGGARGVPGLARHSSPVRTSRHGHAAAADGRPRRVARRDRRRARTDGGNGGARGLQTRQSRGVVRRRPRRAAAVPGPARVRGQQSVRVRGCGHDEGDAADDLRGVQRGGGFRRARAHELEGQRRDVVAERGERSEGADARRVVHQDER